MPNKGNKIVSQYVQTTPKGYIALFMSVLKINIFPALPPVINQSYLDVLRWRGDSASPSSASGSSASFRSLPYGSEEMEEMLFNITLLSLLAVSISWSW